MNATLKNVRDIIVSQIDPDQIILFGSYARGDYRDDSDIDILVLKKGIKGERKLASSIYKAFYKKIHKPVDVIVMDYDKYQKLSDTVGFIYKIIKKEGEVIYERV